MQIENELRKSVWQWIGLSVVTFLFGYSYAGLVDAVETKASEDVPVVVPAASPPVTVKPLPEQLEISYWYIDINGGKQHEIETLTDGQRVYLPVSAAQGLYIKEQPIVYTGPQGSFFLPQEIPGIKAANADFNKLELHLTMDSALLPAQSVNLSAANIRPLTPEANWSGWLDYSFTQTDSDNTVFRMFSLSPHIRIAGLSFLTNYNFQSNNGINTTTRIQTQAFHDWPEHALHLSLGDTSIDNAELGSSIAFAGIQLQRDYSLQPGFIQTSAATFSGTTSSPSTAFVYINGVLVGQTQLAAGPFSFENLRDSVGLRDIQVVVQDASGMQATYTVPYYFTNTLLKKGLDQFNIGTGLARQNFGSGRYDGNAFIGNYLYGLTDDVSIGVRGSAVSDDKRISPLVTARLGSLGVATLILASRWNNEQRHTAQQINFDALHGHTDVRVSWRHASNGFDDPPPLGISPLLDSRARDALSFGIAQTVGRLGRFTLSTSQQWHFNGTRASDYSIGWSHNLPYKGLLHINSLLGLGEGKRTTGFFISATFPLGKSTTFDTGYRNATNSSAKTYAEVTHGTPPDGGVGYQLYTSTQAGSIDKYGNISWRAPWFDIQGGVRRTDTSSGKFGAEQLSISGALATVDGKVYATRLISNSFAVVSVGYPDVTVYLQSSPIGRTDASGSLMVPSLAPFTPNYISVNTDQLPEDVDLVQPKIEVVPANGAGLLLSFDLPKIAALTGHLMRHGTSVDNHVVDVKASDGKESTMRTSNRGYFEMENITPGTWQLTVPGSPSCTVQVVVPDHAPAIMNVGEVYCE